LLFLATTFAPPIMAQNPPLPDSAEHHLPNVVVTADRVPGNLGTQTAVVTRVSSDELLRQPVQRLTDGLRSVPGLIVLNAGAMGEQPRLIIRGFYGGGETDYAAVLMDGVPLTNLAAGLANWDVIPITAIRAIEVVRGSSSALYGDAAVGGVINILTNADIASPARWRLAAGDYGTVDGSGAWSGSQGARLASIFGGYRRSTGFRDHELGDATSMGGSVDLYRSTRGVLSVSALAHARRYDDPGPVPESLVENSPRTSLPFFRFDQNAEQLRRLSVHGSAQVGEASIVSGYLTGESVSADLVRTLQLAPDFSDTQSRASRARRVIASAQLSSNITQTPWPQRIVVGTDISLGALNSTYRPLVMGDETSYANPVAAAGDIDASGRGGRDAFAAFANWENVLWPRLRLVAGGRMDWMRDAYRTDLPAGLARSRSVRQAFSPKLGLNFSYLENAFQSGHVYASIGRSFKAPTLDQLFDQRPVPIPFPPYSVTTSNPELRPQRGSAVEAGISHRAATGGGHALEFTLAAYRQQMRDELDFDLGLFRYVNVGRSEHKGVELGARADGWAGTSVFATVTRQNIVAKNGDNAGRQLKAVPRHALSAGITGGPPRLQGTLSVSEMGGAFLDDANQRRLPAYTRVDARVTATAGALRFNCDVINVLDRKLISTGFPDPSGTGVVYYYPAARRTLQIGIGSAW
jgi:outer membrane receptor protein involved in Fe transport